MIAITQDSMFFIVAATHLFEFDETCKTTVDIVFCSNTNAYRCKKTSVEGIKKDCNQTVFALTEGCDKDIHLPLGAIMVKLFKTNTDTLITQIPAHVQKIPIIQFYPC